MMPASAKDFAHAIGYRLAYIGEVGVAQIEEQLLKGAGELYERMTVGIGAVDLLLEVYVLNDVGRVLHAAFLLEAAHRK